MELVVDLQGFRRSSNIFVLKEAAIIEVKKDAFPAVLLFQPPCKWEKLLKEERRVNQWLQTHFHGIPWSSGTIPYGHLIGVLQSSLKDATKIYVKGFEKRKWLEEILPGKLICNADSLSCPSLQQMKKQNDVRCLHHPLYRKPKCAVRNAYALKDWLLTSYLPQQTPLPMDEEDGWDCAEDTTEQVPTFSKFSHAKCNKEILFSMYN